MENQNKKRLPEKPQKLQLVKITQPPKNHILLKWFVLGLVLMVLNRTVWPELGEGELNGLYQVATLWVNVLDRICDHILPYMQQAGNWGVATTPKVIEFVKIQLPEAVGKMWPYIQQAAKNFLIFMLIMGISIIVSFLIVAYSSWRKKKDKSFYQELTEEFKKALSFIRNWRERRKLRKYQKQQPPEE